MKLAARRRSRKQPAKITPADVIREKLDLAHALHPGYLMPGAIISALSEAGFRIISDEDFDREIAAAHQAGVEEGSDW